MDRHERPGPARMRTGPRRVGLAGWRRAALTAGVSLWLAGLAVAQPYIYPTRGQSQEQMSRDRYDCHVWAVQQTGVDPMASQAAPAPSSTGRGAVRGAAGGAALGAVGGAIAGDAGKGAAIGAATGALFGGMRQARGQQQAQAAATQQRDGYNRALGACLEGRGYTVK